MFAPKLRPGDHVRVIAPALSMSIISKPVREIANKRFKDLGLTLSFGKHVEELDEFTSSSIESRIEDLHAAFADPKVKAVITVIGGFSSNQLLRYIDWDLIKKNPKVFCGYSDITVLQNAILQKTGLVTYSGPHYSTFGMEQRFDFTLEHFKKCLFEPGPFELKASDFWSDDPWFKDQAKRNFVRNGGHIVVNEGAAEGKIVGGNLCTFNLLHGTEYMPSLVNSILFIEEDGDVKDTEIDRNLQSIIHLPGFEGVKGILVGRFQRDSEMTEAKLRKIISTKKELANIPVIAGIDFGHTDPYITFPVGGSIKINATKDKAQITITEH
ncbi:MAG: S66 peptidase family protein [Oligoflexales bacterium]